MSVKGREGQHLIRSLWGAPSNHIPGDPPPLQTMLPAFLFFGLSLGLSLSSFLDPSSLSLSLVHKFITPRPCPTHSIS